MTTTPEQLDEATLTLIFALRDSLTDDGPSFIDFWSGGRCISALEKAASASCAAEALTKAAHSLQIPQIYAKRAKDVVEACAIIDQDYQAWARHIERNRIMIVALADVKRQEMRAEKTARNEAKKTETKPTDLQEVMF